MCRTMVENCCFHRNITRGKGCQAKEKVFNLKIRLLIVLLILTFMSVGCSQTVTDSDKNDPITGFAWEIINRDIENLESNPAVNIIDSKITRLELVETFDALAGNPIQVYALEYRLLPGDLKKVVMAGGMSYDEEGWLTETSSMGRPLLVITHRGDDAELTGIIMTGEAAGKEGMEKEIRDLLERKAQEEKTSVIEENAVPVKFKKLGNEQKIKTEDNMQIVTVLLNENVDSGRAYIYEKVDDKENLHGGFTVGVSFYDLGAVGDLQGFLDELTYVRTLELYGKTVIKFQGVFGSHVSNTSYFIIDRGIPVPFLSTEGITTEMDIDGDGIKEIVVEMPGTIPSAKIFEWNGDSFLAANVDEALGAGSVIFNQEDGSFSAYYKRPGSEDTLVTEYYYSLGGMKLKKDLRDFGDTLSENTIDYNKDSRYEKVIVKMTEGKQYEETEAGPFQGWNWQGKFILQLIDDKGNEISELDLNKTFKGEELIFNRVFLLKFEDYNNDGNMDFAVGQYGSSNGNLYKLFTLIDNKIKILPVQTGTIFNSAGNSRYATTFEKVSEIGFLSFYYDNSLGKIIKQYFVWDGSQFVLHSAREE